MSDARPILRIRGLTITTLICGLALAGCSVGPDYHRPPVTVPAQWKIPPQWKEGQPRDTEIKQNFWDIFGDKTLTALELEATANSPDLMAAFDRVDQARAVARITRADLMPNVTFDPYGNRTRYSPSRTAQPESTVFGYTGDDWVLPVDLSYEIDLWGRVRRSFRAAREQAQASAADYATILLELQSDIARTYFAIRSTDLDRQILAKTITLRERNLTMVNSLHQGGADSAVDVAEAQTELASAQADLVGLDLNRVQLENTLAVLCGQSASTFSLPEISWMYQPPPIPVGLPSDLLERRPDVAEAERRMAAASEGIGIAKAAYFPAVQLTAAAGTESVDIQNVFNWENRIWTIGPNITLPVFEGGRIKAEVQRARAAYAETVAQYRSQVLVAFRDVENGLAGLRLLKAQFDAQMRAVDGAQKGSDLSRNRYKEGLASYFEVVVADRTLLDNQITAYDLNGQRIATTILLIKALGGGWNPNNPLMTNGAAPLHRAD